MRQHDSQQSLQLGECHSILWFLFLVHTVLYKRGNKWERIINFYHVTAVYLQERVSVNVIINSVVAYCEGCKFNVKLYVQTHEVYTVG